MCEGRQAALLMAGMGGAIRVTTQPVHVVTVTLIADLAR